MEPGESPLVVGVVIDLERTPAAGGHVKCWERLAEAACGRTDVDLTVHFLGRGAGLVELAPNVRYRTHRPVWPTSRFRFLVGATPDLTDLWPYAPGLARSLAECDVLHTTGAHFALARTALRYAERHGVPIAMSLHTDVPKYTRVFAAAALEPLLGPTLARRAAAHLAARMARQLARRAARCDWVLASSGEELAPGHVPPERLTRLRRGIDRARFKPGRHARARLSARFGIPVDVPVVLFVGRVDAAKSPIVLAEAARQLLERGFRLHVVFAGRGPERDAVQDRLGAAATCTGALDQDELALLYAGADVFALPSRTELLPNVVLEAKSAGLPVLVSAQGGARRLIDRPGVDGLVLDDAETDAPWAEALEALLVAPERRRALGAAARADIERRWPSWRDVLEQDVLPVWRRIAGGEPRARPQRDETRQAERELTGATDERHREHRLRREAERRPDHHEPALLDAEPRGDDEGEAPTSLDEARERDRLGEAAGEAEILGHHPQLDPERHARRRPEREGPRDQPGSGDSLRLGAEPREGLPSDGA